MRDHRHSLAYFGSVRYVSDSGKERELVLEQVDVYNNDDGQKLYGTKAIYLSLDKGDVSIQIPEIARETAAQKGSEHVKE